MQDFIKRRVYFLLGVFFVLFFFSRFFVFGLFPVPTDTIVGLYHPFRDFYSRDYPRGIPFENSQVTDPIRQQYPWRELAISEMLELKIPSWNPYSFAGYPLVANFQTAAFFPGNLIFLLLPFETGWSLLIVAQPLLAFVFMFLYLRSLKVSDMGALISSVAFAFCGFFTSWLEWGNVAMTGAFLPIILLSIDKITGIKNYGLRIMNQKQIVWGLVFVVSLVSSFFAGHLQTFFYITIISFAYFLLRWFEYGRKIRTLITFSGACLLFILLTAIQWIPTLRFILLSAREIDQVSTAVEGWFVPWQNLTQFIAPDFFGNPATLNYWGIWNYGEFIGYIGILPLIFALGAIIFRRDKTSLFFTMILIFALVFALPSLISNIPFKLSIPLISTSQPTRLLYVVDFALVVLAAFGFDYFRKAKTKLLLPVGIFVMMLTGMWGYVLLNDKLPAFLKTTPENLGVTLSNLRLPSLIILSTITLICLYIFINKNFKNINIGGAFLLLAAAIFLFDIARFADKYTVFAEGKYLYPSTKTIDFLREQGGSFRIMASDSRMMPPNFSSIYRIETIDGYDPLYTLRYAELAAAIGRNDPNINPPFGFNRIITPQNYHSELISILNVKYLLSFGDIKNENFIKVFEEGETSVYENKKFLERTFFVRHTIGAENKYDAIGKIFENKKSLSDIAVIEDNENIFPSKEWSLGSAEILSYDEDRVVIKTQNEGEGFLVLTDSFYPTWRAAVDGIESEIFLTDYNFRGIIVPVGIHEIVFYNSLF